MVHLQELNRDDRSSYFHKTVMLRDWWLIKCPDEFEGKRFGVAGTELMSPIDQRAVRVFTSAPIVKAVDVWTLETSDGICILLKGLINKERSVKGGFSPEIFRHFIFGFAPHWEEISNKCFEGESSCGAGIDSVSLRIDTADRPILTPCKNKESPPESKHKNIIREINTAETNDEDNSNQDCASPEVNMAVRGEISGDKSRKTRPCSTKRPVTSEETKVEQITARKSLRLQLKAGGTSTESERKSDAVKVLNLSDCREHSSSLPTPVMERSSESLNEAKSIDAEKDDVIVDDALSPEVYTALPGEISAPQVDGSAKRHTGPASTGKITRKYAAKESASLNQRKFKHKTTRASPRLLIKEYEKNNEAGKRENSNKMSKSVKSDSKVKPLKHSEKKVEADESCFQEDLTGARSKRRINFEVEAKATPAKQARKQNTTIISPESLSIKRSRSGRLLLSTLEFWRNQVPVYDADRKIIGINQSLN